MISNRIRSAALPELDRDPVKSRILCEMGACPAVRQGGRSAVGGELNNASETAEA